MTTQPRDAFRVRDMQRAKLEVLSLAEPEEPPAVVRSVLSVPWATVTRMVGRLFPKHELSRTAVVRTYSEDTDGNGVADTYLVFRATACDGRVTPALVKVELLPDPSMPPTREVVDVLVMHADLIERRKQMVLAGC